MLHYWQWVPVVSSAVRKWGNKQSHWTFVAFSHPGPCRFSYCVQNWINSKAPLFLLHIWISMIFLQGRTIIVGNAVIQPQIKIAFSLELISQINNITFQFAWLHTFIDVRLCWFLHLTIVWNRFSLHWEISGLFSGIKYMFRDANWWP